MADLFSTLFSIAPSGSKLGGSEISGVAPYMKDGITVERAMASASSLQKNAQGSSLNAVIKGSLLKTASLNAYTLVYDTYESSVALNANIILTTLLNGLISYWKLDGNSNDEMGIGNGTDSAMTYGAGKINAGGTFNGSSSQIVLPQLAAYKPSAFTISAWAKTTSGGYLEIFESYNQSGTPAGFEFRENSGSKLEMVVGNGSSYTSCASGQSINTGALIHLVGTYDGLNINLYINGSPDGVGSFAPGIAYTGDTRVRIGVNNYTGGSNLYFWNGTIDEVGFWSRALTPTEITSLYNLGAANPYSFPSPTTGQLVANITTGASARSIAYDGTCVWVTGNTPQNVTKIDEVTGGVIGTYVTGVGAGVGIAFDGTNIWTANYSTASVSKVNITTGAVIASYSVPASPYGMIFDGTNIWVSHASGGVSKIRLSDGVVLVTASTGTNPYTLTSDGTNVWTVNYGSSNVTKIRASDGVVQGTYAVGANPFGGCFDGVNVWTANYGAGTVSKIRTSDGAVIGTFSGGPAPSGPNGITSDGTNIWVSNYTSNTVQGLLAATGAPIGNYNTGTRPQETLVTPTGVWITNSGASAVTKLKK